MRDIFAVLALVALALSIGCRSRAETGCAAEPGGLAPAWTESDSWYAPPPEWDYDNWRLVDSSFVHLVVHCMEGEAERLVSDAGVVGLTQPQAERFLAKSVTLREGQSLYLVRGIFLNPYGRFKVYTKDGWVWVTHGSLGKRPLPMKRQALVLQLQQAPTRVFVTCTMAE